MAKPDALKKIADTLNKLNDPQKFDEMLLENNFRKVIFQYLQKHEITIPMAHAHIVEQTATISDKIISINTMYNFLLRNKNIDLNSLSQILYGLNIKINLTVK